MDIFPLSPAQPPGTDRRTALLAQAEELEAAFLAEMLGHSGLGGTEGDFGGGTGAAQFSSFLRQEQARAIVDGGGVGLAELIFNSLVEANHADRP